ncbi:MAG: SOS response-associated peptidase [Pseudomonadota bacterium]
MCGRYVLEGPLPRLIEHFGARIHGEPPPFVNSYNIAPTAQVPVVRINREGERVILLHTWGLIPHWAADKTISAKLNNARGETVHEKPSFRTGFKKFRCLIPASGYYEWQAPPEGSKARKQPFYIQPSDSPYFAMAGVCDHWVDKRTGELTLSTAIITTTPCDSLKPIHDRMPVMIEKSQWADWLDPARQDIEALKPYIRSHPSVVFHKVSLNVSATGHNRKDDDSLIKPIE